MAKHSRAAPQLCLDCNKNMPLPPQIAILFPIAQIQKGPAVDHTLFVWIGTLVRFLRLTSYSSGTDLPEEPKSHDRKDKYPSRSIFSYRLYPGWSDILIADTIGKCWEASCGLCDGANLRLYEEGSSLGSPMLLQQN